MTARVRIALTLMWLGTGLAAIGAGAQSFDNFDGTALDGFDFDVQTLDDVDVPSLGENGFLPDDGTGIDLQITDGQSGVGFTTFPGTGTPVTSVSQPETAQAGRAILRALDKTLGRPTDVDMAVGETVMFGRIAIRLVECRFPADDPSSDAFAHLEILDVQGRSLFDGWMIASSPALSALEHARYDVWVLRCTET
jgi:hypothetical protein